MKFRLCLFGLLTLSYVSANMAASHSYLHPHEFIQHAQQLETAISQLTDSDWEEIDAVHQALSPLNVLRQVENGVANTSSVCFDQMLYMVETLTAGRSADKAWVLDMLDAWGKPSAGIRRVYLSWLGNFDECRETRSSTHSLPANSSMVKRLSFEGKYCGLGTSVGSPHVSVGMSFGINVGACFPSGCSEEDVRALVTGVLHTVHVNFTKSMAVDCQEKSLPYSNAAITTIVFYCIMGSVCLLGTLYDILCMLRAPDEPCDADVAVNGQLPNDDDAGLLIPQQEAERKPGRVGELLMCFSLYTNGCKLLSTKQPPGSLTCLHGIRFISLSWVILGHTGVFSTTSTANMMTVSGWMKRWTFQVLLNGTIAVDSFFAISALLTSYLFLKELDRKKTTPIKFLISVPVMYLHRYIRLTPAYAAMILFYACLSLYMYNSPLKPTHTTIADTFCEDYWWTSLLYVNNVIQPLKECAPWGWYLSNDFQFFLVTPFVVYLMYRIPTAGLVLAITMVLASCAAAVGVTVRYDLGVSMFVGLNPAHIDLKELANDAQDYYMAPWTRYQSFGVGVIFGFLLWRCRGRLPVSRAVNLLLWAVSGAMMLAVLYGPYHLETEPKKGSVAESALYNGWARVAWTLGLGYIMLACCLRRGGWVNEFLSWPGFVPLSRMTYCAYLVHPVIIIIFSASNKYKVVWTDATYISLYVGYLSLAYAVAFLFSLTFEAPFMLIDKKFLTGKLK